MKPRKPHNNNNNTDASRSCLIISRIAVALLLVHLLHTSDLPSKFREVMWDESMASSSSSSTATVSKASDKRNRPQHLRKDYQLAKEQSYGFFQDISEANWRRLQQISSEHQPHMYPDNPLKFTDLERRGTTPSWYQTNYEPDFSCQFERRVGGNSNGDGPKWVCDPHRITENYRRQRNGGDNKCLVYSIGSNGDFQFETGLQQLLGPGVCEIHIFDMDDYSNEMKEWSKKHNVADLHFHQWGLTTAATAVEENETGKGNAAKTIAPVSKDYKYRSIANIVQSLGHSKREQIDIFKIDCESCEWDTFEEWLDPATMPRLQQILIELHRSPPTKVLPFFDTLRAKGYVTFHKEPNIQHSQGNCIEYAFLKLAPSFFQSGS
ncbi:unnamed protein product [Cylindrotheca closterium]|uniref:Methyltransferase domain-containing protein n=1 Tax=Cylindrotheca closterium TaxID=2856 RepID=A0AAD2PW61_9STRA|nr:unnamed protein product [Cylindrotheca closterium]